MRKTRVSRFFLWLGIGVVADSIAYVLGACWRAYARFWDRILGDQLGIPIRTVNGRHIWDPRAGVLSIVRTWGGIFLDYGGAAYNARHPAFGCVGDNVADDTAGLALMVAAANSHVADSTNGKRAVGAKCVIPHGQYRSTATLAPFPGVLITGSGNLTSVIVFEMTTSDTGVLFDAATTGHTSWSSFGWGGGIRDITLTTKSYLVSGQTCGAMLKVKDVSSFHAENVALIASGGVNLHIEDCLNSTYTNILCLQSDGACNVFLTGTSTTISFKGVWATQCRSGPAWDLTGTSISLDTCIAETCGTVTPSGAYGVKIRYGTFHIKGMHCEDCADHDIYVGYEDYPASGRTTVVIDNPTFLTGATKAANKGGIYLDYCDNAHVNGGSISAAARPLQMTANCGEVTISSDFGSGGLVPLLTSAAHWRTKTDLTWVNHTFRTQFKDKAAIAQAGTAVLTIPTRATFGPAFRVYWEVYYTTSNDLRAGGYIDIFHDGDGNSDGGAAVTILANDTTGNFRVQAGDFAVTYPSGTSTVVTYTNSNLTATTNYIDFQIPVSESVVGDVTIA